MKILTWNIERVKKGADKILLSLSQFDADILILTETNSAINPGNLYHSFPTKELPPHHDGINYESGENRTTIWSKYPIVSLAETYDNYTCVCADVETEFGILKIYGTIIGVFGGIGERFKNDLSGSLSDFKKFDKNQSLCIAGDLNTFLSGYAYPSHSARQCLVEVFNQLDLKCFTADLENNVDHIALSNHFTNDKNVAIEIWNHDKKLSDHIGICLTIT